MEREREGEQEDEKNDSGPTTTNIDLTSPVYTPTYPFTRLYYTTLHTFTNHYTTLHYPPPSLIRAENHCKDGINTLFNATPSYIIK